MAGLPLQPSATRSSPGPRRLPLRCSPRSCAIPADSPKRSRSGAAVTFSLMRRREPAKSAFPRGNTNTKPVRSCALQVTGRACTHGLGNADVGMQKIASTSTRAENLRSGACLDRTFSPSGKASTATLMPKRTQAHRAKRKTAGACGASAAASRSAREGGSNQPYHRKQSRVAGQSGSMYVDRATFIDDQFCKYMILESTTPIAL